MNVWRFFKKLFSEWGSRLSGGASVPLTLLALYTQTNKLKFLYGCLAFITGWVAAYRVWLKEYERANKAETRNKFPELDIELLGIFWDVSKVKKTNDVQVNIITYLRVTNKRGPATVIKEATLSLKAFGETYTSSFRRDNLSDGNVNSISHSTKFRTGNDVEEPYEFTHSTVSFGDCFFAKPGEQQSLERGIPQEGYMQFAIPSMKTEPSNDSDLPIDGLMLCLTDSFDRKHVIDSDIRAIPIGEAQAR